MKLVATTVGRMCPEEEAHNQHRLRAGERALEKAADLASELIALPAGFFTARSSLARDNIAQTLITKAKKLGIATVFGVDQDSKDLSKEPRLKSGL